MGIRKLTALEKKLHSRKPPKAGEWIVPHAFGGAQSHCFARYTRSAWDRRSAKGGRVPLVDKLVSQSEPNLCNNKMNMCLF